MIGGRDVADDRRHLRKCTAIVGTLGRVLHLLRNNVISMLGINTIVLDEADKLISSDFRAQINDLFAAVRPDRQIIASSATYANGLDRALLTYMRNPIAVSSSQSAPILIGVKQYLYEIEDDLSEEQMASTPAIQVMLRKIGAVRRILNHITFKQCILFSNSQLRAESYYKHFVNDGWTMDLILGKQEQTVRTETFRKFCDSKTRLLMASDLMARGVDVPNVNLVINLDVPSDSSTYLHRIGRCGRYGTHGIAITLACDGNDRRQFEKMVQDIGGSETGVLPFPPIERLSDAEIWDFSSRGLEDKPNDSNNCFVDVQRNENLEAGRVGDGAKTSVEEENFDLLEIAQLMIGSSAAQVSIDADIFAEYSTRDNRHDESANAKTAAKSPSNHSDDENAFAAAMGNITIRDESDASDGSTSASGSDSDFHSGTIGDTEEQTIVEQVMDWNEEEPRAQPVVEYNLPDQTKWQNIYWQQVNQINRYVRGWTHRK